MARTETEIIQNFKIKDDRSWELESSELRGENTYWKFPKKIFSGTKFEKFINVDYYWNNYNVATPRVDIEFRVGTTYNASTKKYEYAWANLNQFTDVNGSVNYNNNFFVSAQIDDNGFRTLTLQLFDRTFTSIQSLLYLAIQTSNQKLSEESGKSQSDVSVNGTAVEFFRNVEPINDNIRIKYGYAENVNETVKSEYWKNVFGASNVPEVYRTDKAYRWVSRAENGNNISFSDVEPGEDPSKNMDDFNNTASNVLLGFNNQSTIVSGWENFFITDVKSELTNTGIRYTITAVGTDTMKLQGYKMVQKFARIVDKPKKVLASLMHMFNYKNNAPLPDNDSLIRLVWAENTDGPNPEKKIVLQETKDSSGKTTTEYVAKSSDELESELSKNKTTLSDLTVFKNNYEWLLGLLTSEKVEESGYYNYNAGSLSKARTYFSDYKPNKYNLNDIKIYKSSSSRSEMDISKIPYNKDKPEFLLAGYQKIAGLSLDIKKEGCLAYYLRTHSTYIDKDSITKLGDDKSKFYASRQFRGAISSMLENYYDFGSLDFDKINEHFAGKNATIDKVNSVESILTVLRDYFRKGPRDKNKVYLRLPKDFFKLFRETWSSREVGRIYNDSRSATRGWILSKEDRSSIYMVPSISDTGGTYYVGFGSDDPNNKIIGNFVPAIIGEDFRGSNIELSKILDKVKKCEKVETAGFSSSEDLNGKGGENSCIAVAYSLGYNKFFKEEGEDIVVNNDDNIISEELDKVGGKNYYYCFNYSGSNTIERMSEDSLKYQKLKETNEVDTTFMVKYIPKDGGKGYWEGGEANDGTGGMFFYFKTPDGFSIELSQLKDGGKKCHLKALKIPVLDINNERMDKSIDIDINKQKEFTDYLGDTFNLDFNETFGFVNIEMHINLKWISGTRKLYLQDTVGEDGHVSIKNTNTGFYKKYKISLPAGDEELKKDGEAKTIVASEEVENSVFAKVSSNFSDSEVKSFAKDLNQSLSDFREQARTEYESEENDTDNWSSIKADTAVEKIINDADGINSVSGIDGLEFKVKDLSSSASSSDINELKKHVQDIYNLSKKIESNISVEDQGTYGKEAEDISKKLDTLNKKISELQKKVNEQSNNLFSDDITLVLGGAEAQTNGGAKKAYKNIASLLTEFCNSCPPLKDYDREAQVKNQMAKKLSGSDSEDSDEVKTYKDQDGNEKALDVTADYPTYSLTWDIIGTYKDGIPIIGLHYRRPIVPKNIRRYSWGSGNPNNHVVKNISISSGSEFAMLSSRAAPSVSFSNGQKIGIKGIDASNSLALDATDKEGRAAQLEAINVVENHLGIKLVKDDKLVDDKAAKLELSSFQFDEHPTAIRNIISGGNDYSTDAMFQTINKGTITILGDPSLRFGGDIQPCCYPIYLDILLQNESAVNIDSSKGIRSHLSGLYVITKITHSLSLQGYLTTLEIMRYPGINKTIE